MLFFRDEKYAEHLNVKQTKGKKKKNSACFLPHTALAGPVHSGKVNDKICHKMSTK